MGTPYPSDYNTQQTQIPQAIPVEATPTGQPQPQLNYAQNPTNYQNQGVNYAAPNYQNQGVNYAAPNYQNQGVAPELQVMDANKPQQPITQSVPCMPGYEFVAGRKKFFIKQRFEAIESTAQAVGCDCIEFKNKYDVFDLQTGQPLLFAKEESDWFCRCCCKPNHTLSIDIYDVTRGNPNNTPPVFRVEKPFKCNCCVCCDICAHEHTSFLSDTQLVGGAKKHMPCGGYFTPVIDLTNSASANMGTITGPCCCVGGLIELCQDIEFDIKDEAEREIGKLIKKKPDNWESRFKEAAGDADMFILDLEPSLPDDRVANILATALLLDYVFFEGGPPFRYNPGDNSISCNCWTCYCFGCVCPCNMQCGGNQNNE